MFEKVQTGIAASKAPASGTVKAGRIVRSAHIAKIPETGELVTGSIEEQARRVFLNLRQALEAAGGGLSDVVQVQVYLIDRADARASTLCTGSSSKRNSRCGRPS